MQVASRNQWWTQGSIDSAISDGSRGNATRTVLVPLSNMFEAFVADLLASYLGHFLDVKREKLRISLWSGDLLPPHGLQLLSPAAGDTLWSVCQRYLRACERHNGSLALLFSQHGRPGLFWTTCG